MPQMSPLNWILLFLFSSLFFFMIFLKFNNIL